MADSERDEWVDLVLDGGEISFVDAEIGQLVFDYAFTLVLDGGTQIRIAQMASFRDAKGVESELLPEQISPALGGLVEILRRRVLKCTVRKSGELCLDIQGGFGLRVLPHERYEAWQITKRNGESLFALPGGGTSHVGRNV